MSNKPIPTKLWILLKIVQLTKIGKKLDWKLILGFFFYHVVIMYHILAFHIVVYYFLVFLCNCVT